MQDFPEQQSAEKPWDENQAKLIDKNVQSIPETVLSREKSLGRESGHDAARIIAQ